MTRNSIAIKRAEIKVCGEKKATTAVDAFVDAFSVALHLVTI